MFLGYYCNLHKFLSYGTTIAMKMGFLFIVKEPGLIKLGFCTVVLKLQFTSVGRQGNVSYSSTSPESPSIVL